MKRIGAKTMLGKSYLPKTCINAINIYASPKLYNQISISSINASLAGLARGVQIKSLKIREKMDTKALGICI